MTTTTEVTLQSSWIEIFGDKKTPMIDTERRERWEQWKALAPATAVNYWTDTSACRDCMHKDGDWCSAAGLPCTVNPILTFRHGLIGMACCGAGYTPRQPDLLQPEE